jgi:hypothetical protein
LSIESGGYFGSNSAEEQPMNLDDLLGSTPVLATAPEVTETLPDTSDIGALLGIKKPVVCPPPGVYHDVDINEYHAWPAEHSTFIKAYAANPLKAVTIPFKGSKYSDMGHAIHEYTLEGIEPKEYADVAYGADKSLRDHPTSRIILNRGFNELSLVWIDEGTGLICKARLDDYFRDANNTGIPSDLKSCSNIEWFHRDLYKMKYHIQFGHYTNGALANDLPVNYFSCIAVQTSGTFPVRVGYLNPEKLADAQTESCRLLGLIKESRERGYWPNFAPPPLIHSWDQMTAADLLEEF